VASDQDGKSQADEVRVTPEQRVLVNRELKKLVDELRFKRLVIHDQVGEPVDHQSIANDLSLAAFYATNRPTGGPAEWQSICVRLKTFADKLLWGGNSLRDPKGNLIDNEQLEGYAELIHDACFTIETHD
jgi:hypothetical protein